MADRTPYSGDPEPITIGKSQVPITPAQVSTLATFQVVRKERLELSRVPPLAPKASASTEFRHFRIAISRYYTGIRGDGVQNYKNSWVVFVSRHPNAGIRSRKQWKTTHKPP